MVYPFYFMIGGMAPLAILIYFLIVADTGIITKTITVLLFAGTFVLQAHISPDSALSQPLIWLVFRIVFALVLLLWLKKDELGL